MEKQWLTNMYPNLYWLYANYILDTLYYMVMTY